MFKKLFLLAVLAAFAFGAEAKISFYELLVTPNNKTLLKRLGRENILSSKSEPDTQAIFFMSSKSKPELFYLIEFYKDEAAYKKHISSAHYKKFASASAEILASKKAISLKKRAAFSKNLTPERLKDAYFHITNLNLLTKSDAKFEKIIKKYMQKSVDEALTRSLPLVKKRHLISGCWLSFTRTRLALRATATAKTTRLTPKSELG